jgi:hypothetical protein
MITLDVYGPDNTGDKIGTLAKPWGIGGSEDLRGPGALVFSLDLTSSTDRALLPPGIPRVIRVQEDGTDVEGLAYVVRDEPKELVSEDEMPFLRYQCEHHISRLGHGRGGAVLRPYGDLAGNQQSPRWFGPMGFDFIERTGIPEPTTGPNPPSRENWQDPRAQVFHFTNRALYRRLMLGAEEWVGHPSRMWLTAASWTDVRVWFDGVELTALNSGVGDRSILQFDIVYDGEDHVIFFDCEGDPPAGLQNAVVWTWAVLSPDQHGEHNDWGRMENRLFTTFNSATYTGPTTPTEPFWQAWENYADGDYPGVNNGYVSMTAIAEAQARGLLPAITIDYDEFVDSDDVAWEHEYVHGFSPQRLGHLHDQLAAWLCEPELTNGNVLRLHQQRGTDRGATPASGVDTVTISLPRSLSATGRGPVATRYLIETEGGFGEVIDADAETALGAKLEDLVSLGEDVHPHTAMGAVELQLASDSGILNDLEVALPSTVVPHQHVFLGDIVQTYSTGDLALADARFTSFRWEVDDANGVVDWAGTLEAV